MNLRDQILASNDLTTEEVTIPEWGGVTVWVRSLTASERGRIEGAMISFKNGNAEIKAEQFQLQLVLYGLVDEHGTRIFGNTDLGELGQKNSSVIARLAEIVTRLSNVGRQDIKEIMGNSDGDQNGDSSSGWPPISE